MLQTSNDASNWEINGNELKIYSCMYKRKFFYYVQKYFQVSSKEKNFDSNFNYFNTLQKNRIFFKYSILIIVIFFY